MLKIFPEGRPRLGLEPTARLSYINQLVFGPLPLTEGPWPLTEGPWPETVGAPWRMPPALGFFFGFMSRTLIFFLDFFIGVEVSSLV